MPKYIATYHAAIQFAFRCQANIDEYTINARDDQAALNQAREHLKSYEKNPLPGRKIPPPAVRKIEVSLEKLVEVREIDIPKSKHNSLHTDYENKWKF